MSTALLVSVSDVAGGNSFSGLKRRTVDTILPWRHVMTIYIYLLVRSHWDSQNHHDLLTTQVVQIILVVTQQVSQVLNSNCVIPTLRDHQTLCKQIV